MAPLILWQHISIKKWFDDVAKMALERGVKLKNMCLQKKRKDSNLFQ